MYHPFPPNYRPTVQPPPAAPTPLQCQRARQAGATHLAPSGREAYRLRFGVLERAFADQGWESWWIGIETEIPAGAIKL